MGRNEQMHELAERFTPGWALVRPTAEQESTGFRFDALDMDVKAGIPVVFDDVSETPISVYVAWVKLVVAASADGDPITDPSGPDDVVVLCDAMGSVLVTSERLLIKLNGGLLQGERLDDEQSVLVSLRHQDVLDLELEAQQKLLGGTKISGVTLAFAGANAGAIRVRPERGLNSPYNAANRGVWGRNVGQHFAECVHGAIFGERAPLTDGRAAHSDVSPELQQYMHVVKNPFT